jgi:hypothetical protein
MYGGYIDFLLEFSLWVGNRVGKEKGLSALKAENPFYIWRAWQDSNLRPTDS